MRTLSSLQGSVTAMAEAAVENMFSKALKSQEIVTSIAAIILSVRATA